MDTLERRTFVKQSMLALGAAWAGVHRARPEAAAPGAVGGAAMTVQEVIDLILRSVPGAPFPNTVDTIKAGDPQQDVKGIVTTMCATDAVIQQATDKGANFIIAHEPTYYNHLDKTDFLEGDPVYAFKKDLLQKTGMVVWRFHDAWHRHTPDGIFFGVARALGWDSYMDKGTGHSPLLNVPPATLAQHVQLLKNRLGIEKCKVIGDLGQEYSRVILLPGAAGGPSQIKAIQTFKPDLVICGEINEWETSEYVRDARYQGDKLALVITGHWLSEEPGMSWLVDWLQPQVPGIPITHIPSGDAFSYI